VVNRIEELEAELAKAIALLDRYLVDGKAYKDDFSSWCDMMDRIKELKGETDE
jgi:hypothetical protein